MNKEKGKFINLIAKFVLFSFIAPIGFLIYRICTTSNLPQEAGIDGRVKTDYILMFLECVLGILAIIIPSNLTKKFKIKVPDNMYYLYVIFLWCAIFLGEIRDFYYVIPQWDTILHTFSGLLTGFIGFSVVDLLQSKNNKVNLSPFFVAFFAFCFSITVGIIWEIYEFSADGIFATNMQKYQLQDGTNLIGRAALEDTMEDIIVDSLGALVACLIGYISLKYQKGWLEKVELNVNNDRFMNENMEEEKNGFKPRN